MKPQVRPPDPTRPAPVAPRSSQPIQPLKVSRPTPLVEPPCKAELEQIAVASRSDVHLDAIGKTLPVATPLEPTAATIPRPKKLPKKCKPWQWSALWLLGSLSILGGIGTASTLLLTSLPPMPNCQDVTRQSLDTQRLFCAQEAAHSGKLSDLVRGITLLKDWSADHPLKQEAQRLITQWSDEILLLATEQVKHNDLKGAVSTATKIPTSSPRYPQAQTTIAHWKTQWQTGATLVSTAQDAMLHQDWSKAYRQVLALGQLEHAYWRIRRADELSYQIVQEKQARESLIQAQRVAKGGASQDLGEAIALLQQVTPATYAAKDADFSLKQWSQALLAQGLKQWQQGNLAGAMAIAQKIPHRDDLSTGVQDLVRFSSAQTLAIESRKGWGFGQMWQLMEAIAAAQQISPQSAFYGQAQVNRQDWQSQLNALWQLQFANLAAATGQQPQLQYAVSQAKAIPPSHARRFQAQSLLFQWRSALERLEDYPDLSRAKRLAKSGDSITEQRSGLQQAIEQARRIALGRSLRTEAQTYIAQWRKELETLEDKPTLQQARQLAEQGHWGDAIQKASQIQLGRALYGEAQGAIAEWQGDQQPAPVEETWTEPSQRAVAPAPVEPPPLEVAPGEPAAVAVSQPEEAIASPEPPVEVAPEVEPPAAPSEPSPSFEGFYDQRYFDHSQ